MIEQHDSLSVAIHSRSSLAAASSPQLTVAQVLSQLPADATPAEQDSAVQHHFPQPPIRYSTRPDTLSIPGIPAAQPNDAWQPPALQEGYLSNTPYFHPEIPFKETGMAGEQLPYRLRSDDGVVSLTLVCCGLLLVYAKSKHLGYALRRRLRNLWRFAPSHHRSARLTASDFLFLLFQMCLPLSVFCFCYFHERDATIAENVSPYLLLAANAVLLLCYFLVKTGITFLVHTIFLDSNDAATIKDAYFSTALLFGATLLPLTLSLIFLPYPVMWAICPAALAFLLFKLGYIYVCFTHLGVGLLRYLNCFLYLCTLEMLPIFLLWNTLIATNQTLISLF